MYNNQYDAIRMLIERLNSGLAAITDEQHKMELLLAKLTDDVQSARTEVQTLRSELASTRNQIAKLSRSMRRRMFD